MTREVTLRLSGQQVLFKEMYEDESICEIISGN